MSTVGTTTPAISVPAVMLPAATAEALNAQGIRPRRAALWRDVQVRSVVRHSGWLADQPEPWPERYHAAASRHNTAPVRAGRQVRALTGLMRCGHCGGSIGYLPRPTGPPGLQCHRADGINRCGGPRKTSADHYERAALAWVAALPADDLSLRAARALQRVEKTDPVATLAQSHGHLSGYHPRESGAVLRASMDLTRALADLRQGR